MEVVTLEEMKNYLRIDYEEDDLLIASFIDAAKQMCRDIARFDNDDFLEEPNARIAVMYAVAYLYEHREEANHHELTLTLRALLSGIRQEEF